MGDLPNNSPARTPSHSVDRSISNDVDLDRRSYMPLLHESEDNTRAPARSQVLPLEPVAESQAAPVPAADSPEGVELSRLAPKRDSSAADAGLGPVEISRLAPERSPSTAAGLGPVEISRLAPERSPSTAADATLGPVEISRLASGNAPENDSSSAAAPVAVESKTFRESAATPMLPSCSAEVNVKLPFGTYSHPMLSFGRRLKAETQKMTQVDLDELTPKKVLKILFPIAAWLPEYPWRQYLGYDIMAGLAVGTMAVPQSMSYANLAGLPGVIGLYGMMTPLIIYGLFGSSRVLGVGPVAVTSLLLGSGLANIYGSNPNPNAPRNPALQDQINQAAIQVCLLAGIFYTCVGVFRLSFVANFLSHSVVSGFMTGAATVIALSQVKYILGIKMPRADTVPDNIKYINNAIGGFKWQEFLMGMSWMGVLILFRYLGGKYKKLVILKAMGPVFITVMGLIFLNTTSWAASGAIAVIGKIPAGLPQPTFSWWGITDHLSEKFTLAVLICAVDLCESLSIAKALAQKNRQEINQTQEIVSLGMANLAGAMFNCYTTTGSFSRSAVNQSVGAKTQVAGLITGFFILFVLLVLTPVLSNMPANIQGAVVIVGVLQLIDWREWWFLLGSNLLDFTVWNVAALGTMIWGVEIGISLSVGLSLALIVAQASFPHIVTLGKIENSRVWRSTELYVNAVPEPGILVVRVDAPMMFSNFANIRQFVRTQIITNKDKIEEANLTGTAPPAQLHSVIFDLSAVPYIDTSAIHLLHDFVDELKGGGRRGGPVQFLFVNPTATVLKQLALSKFFARHGTQDFFFGTHEAVEWAKANQLPQREIAIPESLAFRALAMTSEPTQPSPALVHTNE